MQYCEGGAENGPIPFALIIRFLIYIQRREYVCYTIVTRQMFRSDPITTEQCSQRQATLSDDKEL